MQRSQTDYNLSSQIKEIVKIKFGAPLYYSSSFHFLKTKKKNDFKQYFFFHNNQLFDGGHLKFDHRPIKIICMVYFFPISEKFQRLEKL